MADTLDVLTLAEGKQAINMTQDNAEHEAELARAITAVSRRLDELVGPVVIRTVTEYHDGGVGTIWPYQTPVSEFTSVTSWDGTTSTTWTADAFGVAGVTNGYLLESSTSYAHGTRILARAGGGATYFPTGSRSVRLIYEAGRYATTADVDARFKQAAAMILRRLWKPEAGAWAQTPDFLQSTESDAGAGLGYFRIDPLVEQWLGDEMKPPALA